ncbi:MAG: S1C family serine protease [Desulfomonilaceae bacterium]
MVQLSGLTSSGILLPLIIILILCGAPVTAHSSSPDAKPARPTPGCPDLVELIKKITPTVVSIAVERKEPVARRCAPGSVLRQDNTSLNSKDGKKDPMLSDSIGSGFFCDREGHIVTNAHVVDSAEKIMVTTATGKVLPARVVAVHPRVDLALIKIAPDFSVREAQIGNSSEIEVGEWVLAVGNPFGLGRTVTIGIVSGKGRFLGFGPNDNFIQTDASINPGNSGGPLFNMVGEVIGVNTAIIASGKGIGFSIPCNYVRELIGQKGKNSNRTRGWLGVYVDDMDELKAKSLGFKSVEGVVVDDVLSATPAFLAGIRKGDLILRADGTTIRDGKHLSAIIAGKNPGDVIHMEIFRDNKYGNVDVVMGRPPE